MKTCRIRTCSDVMKWFREKWPEHLACDWDNVGLLAGRRQKTVERVYVALDATGEVIGDAIEKQADMLITHHPMIFGSIKKVSDADPVGNRLIRLIQADISYYAGHTSFDIAKGGMADLAAERLGLFTGDTVPLEVTGEQDGEPVGIGKTGMIREPLSVEELAEIVKERFGIPFVTVYGNRPGQKLERIAISPGSGKSMMAAAAEAGADVLITGDMGHHEGLDLAEEGIALIDAGHYGLEHIFVEAVADALEREGLEVFRAPAVYPCRVL